MKAFLLAVALGSLFGAVAHAGDYSIVQGSTSASVAHFTVVAPAHEDLTFEVRAGDAASKRLFPVNTQKVTYPGSAWAVHRLKVTGLAASEPLFLELNRDGQRVDRRRFKTLDPEQPGGRVAVGSCMLRQFHNAFLWSNLADPANRPDVFLLIGDAVYLDRSGLFSRAPPVNGLQVWDEFIKSRQATNLYFWDHLVPVLSVWDDHDAGYDNADSTFPLMPEIRRIYEIFFANDEIAGIVDHGPGLAKKFRLFNKNFIMLDGRSFRNASAGNPLFGDEQDRWLHASVRAGANFLISGSQFYGRHIQKDSLEYNWPEFAAGWTWRLAELGRERGATFAFLSGDIHFSEVQDLEPDLFGYPTVEITSSNLHSAGLPGHYVLKPDNPRRREVTGTHNVVLLEFSPAYINDFIFDVRSMGWRGGDLFSTEVAIAGFSPYLTAARTCEARLGD